jgi:hypothetical protein
VGVYSLENCKPAILYKFEPEISLEKAVDHSEKLLIFSAHIVNF